MSLAYVLTADSANNSYTVSIPGFSGTFNAQCVTTDPIASGSEVEMVDLNNEPPDKVYEFGNIRLLPNSGEFSYAPSGKTWKKTNDLRDTKKNSLAVEYIYSSKQNPIWQDIRPLYRKGKITAINSLLSMTVQIQDTKRNNPTLVCPVQYPNYSVSQAFGVDDIVVVKFTDDRWDNPIIVGYWDNPQIPWDTKIAFSSLTPSTTAGASDNQLIMYNVTPTRNLYLSESDLFARCPSYPWIGGPPYSWMDGYVKSDYWYLFYDPIDVATGRFLFRCWKFEDNGAGDPTLTYISFNSSVLTLADIPNQEFILYKADSKFQLYIDGVLDSASLTTTLNLYPYDETELDIPIYGDKNLKVTDFQSISWAPCSISNETFYYVNQNSAYTPYNYFMNIGDISAERRSL